MEEQRDRDGAFEGAIEPSAPVRSSVSISTAPWADFTTGLP